MHVVCMWCVCGVYVVCMWCVYGVYVVCMWCVCGVHVVCMWCVCDMHVVCMWCVCGVYVACMWCVCGVYVVCMWCMCGVYVVCVLHFASTSFRSLFDRNICLSYFEYFRSCTLFLMHKTNKQKLIGHTSAKTFSRNAGIRASDGGKC